MDMGTQVARISDRLHARAQELAESEGLSFAEAMDRLAHDQAVKPKFNPEDFRITENVDQLRKEMRAGFTQLHESLAAARVDLHEVGAASMALLGGQKVIAEEVGATRWSEEALDQLDAYLERKVWSAAERRQLIEGAGAILPGSPKPSKPSKRPKRLERPELEEDA